MKTSLIIPFYNEEAHANTTIIKCIDYMTSNFDDYEIIAVNDGSIDKTEMILNKFKGFIKIINLPNNMGKGYAVRTGVLYSKGDNIIFTDADLSYGLSYIAPSIFMLKDNDIILGQRNKERPDYPFYRKYPSIVFNDIANSFLKSKIADTQCGFKCFTKKSAYDIFSRLKVNRFSFDFELIYIAQKLGLKVATIDVKMKNENKHSSVNLIKDANNMIYDMLRVKVNDFKKMYD